jgi:hypothetical protein
VTPAPPAAARPKPKVARVKKIRREPRRIHRKQAEMEKASRSARATLARETLNLKASPPLRREPPISSASLPVAVPLIALGLMLLLGAALVFARPVSSPGVAERVAAFGFGAIVLALLWLNVTVLF